MADWRRKPKGLFTRHEHFGDKFRNWNLTVQRQILLVGDSNLSRLPECNNCNVQIDSYPGARLAHLIHLMKKVEQSGTVKKVIFSIGINDKNSPFGNFARQLDELFRISANKFPDALIVLAEINFSYALPLQAKRTLSHLNEEIQQFPHIRKLPENLFSTGKDCIHWSKFCAQQMLFFWRNALGF